MITVIQWIIFIGISLLLLNIPDIFEVDLESTKGKTKEATIEVVKFMINWFIRISVLVIFIHGYTFFVLGADWIFWINHHFL